MLKTDEIIRNVQEQNPDIDSELIERTVRRKLHVPSTRIKAEIARKKQKIIDWIYFLVPILAFLLFCWLIAPYAGNSSAGF